MLSRLRAGLPSGRAVLLAGILVLTIAGPWLLVGAGVTHALSRVALPEIALLAAAVMARWSLIAFRLWVLLRLNGVRLRARDVMTGLWAYDFAAESTPAGVGGPAVGLLLFRFLGVPFKVIAGVGALTLVLDALAILVILAVLAATSSLLVDHALLAKVTVILVLLAGALLAAWLLATFRHALIRRLARVPLLRRLPAGFRRATVRTWLHVGRAIEEAGAMPPGRLLLVLAASAGAWLGRLSVLYLAAAAVDAPLPVADAMLIQLVGGMAGVLVLLPAGFLGADLMTSALLHPFMEASTIAAVLILWRIFTFHANIVLGGASLVWYSFRMTDARAPREP